MLWVFLAECCPIRGWFSLWCHFTIGKSRCNRSVSRWTSSVPTIERNTFCTTATYLLELIGYKSALNSSWFLLLPDGVNVEVFEIIIMNKLKLASIKMVYAAGSFTSFSSFREVLLEKICIVKIYKLTFKERKILLYWILLCGLKWEHAKTKIFVKTI